MLARVTAAAPPVQLMLASAVGNSNLAATLQRQQRGVQLIHIQPCIQPCCAFQCLELPWHKLTPPALPPLLLASPAEKGQGR
jgi:hypothetical protein